MKGCICIECEHQCSEYYANGTSDKAYYEWTHKQDKCRAEDEFDEFMARANRLSEPPTYIKGHDY